MYGLLLSLKNEIVKIAPRGRVNCVAPGWVRTPMAAEALKDPNIIYRALATYVSPSLCTSSHPLHSSLAFLPRFLSPVFKLTIVLHIFILLFRTPLKKVATARDIANQILLLASPVMSGHVTGQVVMVEGGMEGRLLNTMEDVV